MKYAFVMTTICQRFKVNKDVNSSLLPFFDLLRYKPYCSKTMLWYISCQLFQLISLNDYDLDISMLFYYY